eukprot:6238528-Prymnesium_polylepis.2
MASKEAQDRGHERVPIKTFACRWQHMRPRMWPIRVQCGFEYKRRTNESVVVLAVELVLRSGEQVVCQALLAEQGGTKQLQAQHVASHKQPPLKLRLLLYHSIGARHHGHQHTDEQDDAHNAKGKVDHLERQQAKILDRIKTLQLGCVKVGRESDADQSLVDHRQQARLRPVHLEHRPAPSRCCDQRASTFSTHGIDVCGYQNVHCEEVVEHECSKELEVD